MRRRPLHRCSSVLFRVGLICLGLGLVGLILPLLQVAGVRLVLNTGPRWYPSLLVEAVGAVLTALAILLRRRAEQQPL